MRYQALVPVSPATSNSGSSTVVPFHCAKSAAEQELGTLLPVLELGRPSMALVALHVPGSGSIQPKPPGTTLHDGPVQPCTPEVLVKWMVRRVLPLGSPPTVCAVNSHQEKASG